MGQKSNLSIINNNIDKDYEITNRNISDFYSLFIMKGVLYGKDFINPDTMQNKTLSFNLYATGKNATLNS